MISLLIHCFILSQWGEKERCQWTNEGFLNFDDSFWWRTTGLQTVALFHRGKVLSCVWEFHQLSFKAWHDVCDDRIWWNLLFFPEKILVSEFVSRCSGPVSHHLMWTINLMTELQTIKEGRYGDSHVFMDSWVQVAGLVFVAAPF